MTILNQALPIQAPQLDELVKRVVHQHEQVLLTENDEPVAVLVDFTLFQRMHTDLLRLTEELSHICAIPNRAGAKAETDKTEQSTEPRQFGQHRGKVHIADDFDVTLPDSFWLNGSL